MNSNTKQLRQSNGQFGHGLDKVCRCGRRKGQHDAVRPFPIGEDLGDGLGGCEGFKAARIKK